MESHPRSGLGEFLRSRRERLSPEVVGLPARARRRTKGLRREEVAELAGIGVDWYVRLEQGRTVTPSEATLDALARVLRLDATERTHLRRLARGPAARPRFTREAVPAHTAKVVADLTHPAYLTGRRWDVLAFNAAAADLFGGFEPDANILEFLLLDPAARKLFGDGWPAQARHSVAHFRAAYDLWAPDPAFTELAERLRAGCPELAGWWEQHDVGRPGVGRKVLHHPVRGELAYDYATFQANENPALKLTVYTPA